MFGDFRTMKPFAILALTLATILLNGCSGRGYDKARYEKMQHMIETSPSNMLGMSLTNASRLLSLEGVPWDRGYDNYPLGEWRLYHFRGFYLALHLHVLPPGIEPGSTQQFSYMEAPLRQTGVWWVGQWKPRLAIDKLTDPKARMSKHWADVERGLKRKSEFFAEYFKTNK